MPSNQQPNILWIGTDEQHRGTVGIYGSKTCKTPHIDALAGDSIIFENAFCPMAVCAPTRAAMMTGRLPSEGGIITNDDLCFGVPERDIGDVRTMESWAPSLINAGYRMAHIGKWHIDPYSSPHDYGFEGPGWPSYGREWREPDFHAYRSELGLPAEPEFVDTIEAKHPLRSPFNPVAARLDGPAEGSLPAFLGHTTLSHLDEFSSWSNKTGNPFFLRCEFWGPHIRCIAPDPYFSMYDPESIELPPSFGVQSENKPRIQSNFSGGWGIATHDEATQRRVIAAYMAYVTCIDDQIGRVLSRLEDLGQADNTIVIFESDHGDMLGAHGLYDKGPFMYDDIYRVPLIIRWPGVTQPGRNDALVYNMDLAATLWGLAGSEPPSGISAQSLLPLLRGEQPDLDRDLIFCEHHRQWDFYSQAMLHSGNDKFIYNFSDTDEYYNLANDPHEMTNLVGTQENQARIGELRTRMHEEFKRIGSPMLHGFERTLAAKTTIEMFESGTGE